MVFIWLWIKFIKNLQAYGAGESFWIALYVGTAETDFDVPAGYERRRLNERRNDL